MDVAVGADINAFSDVEQPAMFCKSLCLSFLGNSLLWFPPIQHSWGLWPFMEGWEAVSFFLY